MKLFCQHKEENCELCRHMPFGKYFWLYTCKRCQRLRIVPME